MALHTPTENQQYWTRLDDQSVNQFYLRDQPMADNVTNNTVVRWDYTQSKWVLAVATIVSNTPSGYNSNLINQNTFGIAIQTDPINLVCDVTLKGGVCSGFSGLNAGTDYWLGSTAGAIVNTRPGSGPTIKIGRALTSTSIFLDISFFKYNPVLMVPIDYAEKDAHVGDWTLISGTGTVVYDNTIDGRFGTGVYTFTGTGSWVLNAFYPASVFMGVGGAAHAATLSGTGSISFGMEQYSNTMGFLSEETFIASSQATSTTWTYWEKLETGSGMNASCRWIRPRMDIVTNPGSTYVDGFLLWTPNFARWSNNSNNATLAALATTADWS